MAQFDVYATPFPDAPFVVQVQSDLLDVLATRTVIPLRPADRKAQLTRLHPTVTLQDAPYTLQTTEIATVMVSVLTAPVQSLAAIHR